MQTDNINVLRDLKVRSSPQSALATSKLLQLRYFCITDRLKAKDSLYHHLISLKSKSVQDTTHNT